MLKKAAALFLVCASAAICLSCSSATSRYLYAAIPTSNEIVAFREDPNSGILTQLAISPITAGPAVQSLVIHPSNKFMYAANAGEGDISLYAISPGSGAIAEQGTRTPVGTDPTVLAMTRQAHTCTSPILASRAFRRFLSMRARAIYRRFHSFQVKRLRSALLRSTSKCRHREDFSTSRVGDILAIYRFSA